MMRLLGPDIALIGSNDERVSHIGRAVQSNMLAKVLKIITLDKNTDLPPSLSTTINQTETVTKNSREGTKLLDNVGQTGILSPSTIEDYFINDRVPEDTSTMEDYVINDRVPEDTSTMEDYFINDTLPEDNSKMEDYFINDSVPEETYFFHKVPWTLLN